jgi:hypothetical protein
MQPLVSCLKSKPSLYIESEFESRDEILIEYNENSNRRRSLVRIRGFFLWACLGFASACMFETENRPLSVRPDFFQYVGDARFSPPGAFSVALEVSREGTAYAAFADSSDSGRAAVMRFSPSSRRWEKIGGGGLSLGPVYMLNMAMDPAGIPYLAFKDEGDSARVTVLRWEPDSLRWVRVGRKGTTPVGTSEFALAMGPTGEIYLGFKDWQFGGRSTVLLYDRAENAWNALGDSGFTDAESNFMTLAVDRAGTPYLGYYDELRTGRASVMRYAGPTQGWIPVGELGFSRSQASRTVIAIDSGGRPYLGYVDGFDGAFKATVQRFASGTWAPLGEESFTSGQPLSLNLSISPKGTPYIAFNNYQQGSALNMLRWDSSAGEWQDVGGASLASAKGRAVALAFGPEGKPWIAFLENDNGRLSVMRLAE